MSLRSQTPAVILAAALLLASPAAAATGSMATGSGDLLQLAAKLLTRVATWVTVPSGTLWVKADTSVTEDRAQESEDSVDDPSSQEGTVIDPNGRLTRSR